MRETLEVKIEKKVVEEVWTWLGIKGSKLKVDGERAYPDRVFWLPGGKPLFIEFKRPGEPLRKNQQKKCEWLRQLGYSVKVFDNVADAYEAICQAVASQVTSQKSRQIFDRARARGAVLRSRFGKNQLDPRRP